MIGLTAQPGGKEIVLSIVVRSELGNRNPSLGGGVNKFIVTKVDACVSYDVCFFVCRVKKNDIASL